MESLSFSGRNKRPSFSHALEVADFVREGRLTFNLLIVIFNKVG